MNLEELLKETDALTYINSLKVTLIELKTELSTIEEMQEYIAHSSGRMRKLVRKADNQYRGLTKILQHRHAMVGDLTINENIEELEDLEKMMEDNG